MTDDVEEYAWREKIVALGDTLDEFLNDGKITEIPRKTGLGYVLMVFELGSEKPRQAYVGNVGRDAAIEVSKRQIEHLERLSRHAQ